VTGAPVAAQRSSRAVPRWPNTSCPVKVRALNVPEDISWPEPPDQPPSPMQADEPPPSDRVTDRPTGPGPRTRRAARNVTVAALAEIAGKLATLAFTVAAARSLGPMDFGAFAYALSLSLLVATLPTWGLGMLLVQRGSAEPARLPALLSETLVWRTAIAVPVFLAAGVAGYAARPDAESGVAFLLVLGATIVDVYTDAGRDVALARQDQRGISMALVVQRFSAAALGITALAAGLGLVGLSVAYLCSTLLGAVGVWRSVRHLGVRPDYRTIRWEGLLRTGRLSVPLGISVIASMALFRIDQVLLAELKSDEAVGAYAAAYRLIETVLFVAWAVARGVLPAMSGEPEPWRIRRGVEQGVAAVAVLYIPFGLGLWLEAEPLVRFLYGPDYVEATPPALRWLAGAPLLFSVGYLAGYGLLALERRWRAAIIAVTALGFNVGANLILIPPFSGTGAAIATTASYAVHGAVALALLVPLVGWIRLARGLITPVLAATLMGVVILLSPAGLLIEVPLGVLVYGLSWYILARWRDREQLEVIASIMPGRLAARGRA
jgi:O-antigen/teichoic acid export membrane protein